MKKLVKLLRHLYCWCKEVDYRRDKNYRWWGVRTADIKGSNCGCCGKWIEGDPGDPSYPPNWRWTLCNVCASSSRF